MTVTDIDIPKDAVDRMTDERIAEAIEKIRQRIDFLITVKAELTQELVKRGVR